ncbi:Hypothetical predicted protein [Paramuricea clavata]|uniref:Uncharacterized protein n=1 Tax=Paramuricea clavata TaxID=317549 RepID=A0A7D9IKY3_PARCT|nr:Hypothetical predicted protein [Paramuricea clavata]
MVASGEENVSSEESDDNIQEKVCMMCVNPPANPKIVPFSARTWNTFLKYVPKWKSLDGDQAEVANKFIDKHAEFNIDNVVDANAIPIPLHASYTDPLNCVQVQDDNFKPEKIRALRSSIDRPTLQSRSQHVLPNICVLCQKEKTITCQITCKRKNEHHVKCSTIDVVNLKQAAEDNKNEALLMQIKDKDCVAIEVKLTHGKEADSYKTGNLKTRLMKKFPQLCFITPRMRSQSEIVYVNDISTAALIEEKELLQDAMHITADREEDSTNEIVKAPTPSKQSNIFDAQTNKLKDSYMTAFELRNIINEPRIPTIIVWDNNDFGEETLSGHGTTHNTNGIVIQHGNTTASRTDPPNASTTDPLNASTNDLPSASTTDPPNASTTDLPNAPTTDPPNASTTDPPNTSRTDPPNASTTDPANAYTTDPANASTTDPPNASTTDVLEKRTRKRSMEPPLANLATYYGGKHEGPAPFAAGISLEESTYAPLLKNP